MSLVSCWLKKKDKLRPLQGLAGGCLLPLDITRTAQLWILSWNERRDTPWTCRQSITEPTRRDGRADAQTYDLFRFSSRTGLYEEAGVPRQNPLRHGENVAGTGTQTRSASSDLDRSNACASFQLQRDLFSLGINRMYSWCEREIHEMINNPFQLHYWIFLLTVSSITGVLWGTAQSVLLLNISGPLSCSVILLPINSHNPLLCDHLLITLLLQTKPPRYRLFYHSWMKMWQEKDKSNLKEVVWNEWSDWKMIEEDTAAQMGSR